MMEVQNSEATPDKISSISYLSVSNDNSKTGHQITGMIRLPEKNDFQFGMVRLVIRRFGVTQTKLCLIVPRTRPEIKAWLEN